MPRRLLALCLSAFLPVATALPARADVYNAQPKLVVIVVIDQFRADYLERYRSEFKGRGFRLFLDHGAWFPDCYYGYANTKTAPGHAAIGTGAYSNGNGISANAWWDLARNRLRPISSVEDPRYTIVGLGAPAPVAADPAQAGKAAAGGKGAPEGASPRNLLASTLGDELRLATDGGSRVYGVSLKDRAAILPAGATANGAFWIDGKSGRFVTSSYYMTQLPQWAIDFNNGPSAQQAISESGIANPTDFYEQVGATNAGNTYEIKFAEALIASEKLGTGKTTDLLTLSLSPNDLEGHRNGPNSPEEHAMVDALDGDLDGFFSWLDKNIPGGLGSVEIALTADHGIAPTPAVSSSLGLPGVYIDTEKLIANLNLAMNAKFSPGENVEYVLHHQELPYLSLNRPSFERAGINEQEAEKAVEAAAEPAFASLAQPGSAKAGSAKPAQNGQSLKGAGGAGTGAAESPAAAPGAVERAAPEPELFRAYTRLQLAGGQTPSTEFGQLIAHSYSPSGGWYVAVFPIAFQMAGSGKGGTTHFSPYSYDRHVPLAFYGTDFKPGVYRGRVQPVDIASTFASLLGVNQPSAAIGAILTQALKPENAYAYPKEPRHSGRSAARRAEPPPQPKAKQP